MVNLLIILLLVILLMSAFILQKVDKLEFLIKREPFEMHREACTN